MTTDRLLTLRLDRNAAVDAIAGWISDEHGSEHYFAGWLALLTLLEQARLTVASEPQDGADTVGEGARARTGTI